MTCQIAVWNGFSHLRYITFCSSEAVLAIHAVHAGVGSFWVVWSWWITVCLLAFIAALGHCTQLTKLYWTSAMLQPVFLP